MGVPHPHITVKQNSKTISDINYLNLIFNYDNKKGTTSNAEVVDIIEGTGLHFLRNLRIDKRQNVENPCQLLVTNSEDNQIFFFFAY